MRFSCSRLAKCSKHGLQQSRIGMLITAKTSIVSDSAYCCFAVPMIGSVSAGNAPNSMNIAIMV